MHTLKRRSVFALILPIALLGGILLTGCGSKDQPKAGDPGYYDGPLKGKGKQGTEDTKQNPPR